MRRWTVWAPAVWWQTEGHQVSPDDVHGCCGFVVWVGGWNELPRCSVIFVHACSLLSRRPHGWNKIKPGTQAVNHAYYHFSPLVCECFVPIRWLVMGSTQVCSLKALSFAQRPGLSPAEVVAEGEGKNRSQRLSPLVPSQTTRGLECYVLVFGIDCEKSMEECACSLAAESWHAW